MFLYRPSENKASYTWFMVTYIRTVNINYIVYKHTSRLLSIYNNDNTEPLRWPALDLDGTETKVLYLRLIQTQT